MVPTNSTLNDVIADYYNTAYERDGGNNAYGPIRFAQNLVGLGESGTITFPYPEKTVHYLVFFNCIGTISSGTVTLETSHDANFTGTWQGLVNRTMSAQTDSTLRFYSGTVGPYLNMRARVSSAIVGGTVEVYFQGVAIDY